MPQESEPLKTLTDRTIRAAIKRAKRQAAGKRIIVRDPERRGLRIRVSSGSGHASWAYRYRKHTTQEPRWITLGDYPAMSLKDARDEADQHRVDRAKKLDPARLKQRAREEARAAKTFRDLCERYVAYSRTRAKRPKKTWANDSRILLGTEATAEIIRSLGGTKRTVTVTRDPATPLVDLWGDKPLVEVDLRDGSKHVTIPSDDIEALLDILEARAPIQCNRTLSCLKQVFKFAVKRKWMPLNPAADLDPRGEEQKRTRTFTDAEIRILWTALDHESSLIRDVMRTLWLTGARSGEVFGATWAEMNLASGWWTIPGARTKNGKEHAVWLAPTVREIIARRRESVPPGCAYVFPSTRKASVRGGPKSAELGPITTIKNAVARLTEKTEIAPWVPHDCRRTTKTRMEDLGVPPHIKHKTLNHISERAVIDDHYDHHDYRPEMRVALDRWDRVMQAIVKNERVSLSPWEHDVQNVKDQILAERGENVVSFRARA